ncbi:MAG: amidohydrolase family protein [Christensenellales bacterium]|jgi:predicted TIM-barrel fold metal-dependent hydrolase
MIIDCHNHIGEPWGTKDRQTADDLLRKMDKAGIDKAVVFPFRYENFDNHYTYTAVKQHPDRLIGFYMAAPWVVRDYDKVARNEIEKYGFKGIKIHANAHSFKMTGTGAIAPIFQVAQDLDIPIIAYSGDELVAIPHTFIPIAEMFPKVNIIMAHSGFMQNTPEAVSVAESCPNIYLAHESGISGGIVESVQKLGAERVLMGTDSPYWDFEVQIKKIEVTVSSVSDRKKIMGGNISRLLKLKN